VTLDRLVQELMIKNPKSVKAATRVDREDQYRVALRLDYVGFP
jgi:hypoxanthine-guanine phosphoribosyltransferase